MRGAPRGCADRCEIDPNRHQPHQHHHHPHNHRHNQPPQRKSIPTPTTNPTTTPYHHPKTTTTTTTKAMFMKLLYFFFLMRAHWNSAARRTLPGNVLCDQRLAANTLELAQYITHRTLPCAQSQLISKKLSRSYLSLAFHTTCTYLHVDSTRCRFVSARAIPS